MGAVPLSVRGSALRGLGSLEALALEIDDNPDGVLWVVDYLEDAHVLVGDVTGLAQHLAINPLEHAFPVFAAHEDNGERRLLKGLDEDKGFVELVKRAEAAGQDDEAVSVLDEHHLATEEIPEVQGEGLELVGYLLHRQLYI